MFGVPKQKEHLAATGGRGQFHDHLLIAKGIRNGLSQF
jgi:hypothetical protein